MQEEQQPQIQVTQKRIFKLITDNLNKLQSDYPELTLRLDLQTVQAINTLQGQVDLEDIAYEFMTQAFLIYEEKILDSEPKI